MIDFSWSKLSTSGLRTIEVHADDFSYANIIGIRVVRVANGGSIGLRITPDDAEEIATALNYAAKLMREKEQNNG